MAEKTEIRVLAKVYELLSEFSDGEIIAATELNGLSPQLVAALAALAKARQNLGAGTSKPQKSKSGARIREEFQRTPITKSQSNSVERKIAALVERALLDRRFFRTTLELEKFFRQFGFTISVRPKDSRRRLLVRVQHQINSLSQQEKEQVISQLEQLAESRQTSGWFSVIRSGGK